MSYFLKFIFGTIVFVFICSSFGLIMKFSFLKILFGLLIIALCFYFPYYIIFTSIVRPKQMVDLAKEFGFNHFLPNEVSYFSLKPVAMEQCILTGKYNGVDFNIKDVIKQGGFLSEGFTPSTIINGKEYIGYLSVNKIRKIIKGETV